MSEPRQFCVNTEKHYLMESCPCGYTTRHRSADPCDTGMTEMRSVSIAAEVLQNKERLTRWLAANDAPADAAVAFVKSGDRWHLAFTRRVTR